MAKWEIQENREPERAALLRGVRRFRNELLQIDPWLPFPQNSCTYKFGEDERPLPVAGLVHLWDHWSACTGRCPACGGDVLGWTFGGLISTGGVAGCCVRCERELFHGVGGMPKVGKEITLVLRSTPYFVSIWIFGGAMGGARLPLVLALRRLGARDLPDDTWATADEPLEVSYTLVTPEGEFPFPERETDGRELPLSQDQPPDEPGRAEW